MPRFCRFFVSPRRDEGAYSKRSVTDEQHRRDEKAAQPEGQTVLGCLARLLAPSQVAADMLSARVLPHRSRAARLSISTGS